MVEKMHTKVHVLQVENIEPKLSKLKQNEVTMQLDIILTPYQFCEFVLRNIDESDLNETLKKENLEIREIQPVKNCKSCKKWRGTINNFGECMEWNKELYTKDNDFCSRHQ